MPGVDNAEFHADRAQGLLPGMVQKGLKADVIVLDPPRAVGQAKPLRIVYVSCNPATLARDLKLLETRGYLAREVQPVDMFPQTSHSEVCCLLEGA